jgi:hypothetical protein
MNILDDYSQTLLKNMYDDCISNLEKKKKSLILISLDANKNTIRNALNASKIEGNDQLHANLISEGFIRCIDPGSYSLTAKGAWYVETEYYNFDINMVLEHLDMSKFMPDNSKINDKNKVLLLVLLASRCFTEDTCAEYSTEETENVFRNLFENSSNFLAKHGYVKSGELFSKTKASSKSELGNYTNSIDKLPSHTFYSFKSGNNKYYLDVAQGGIINKKFVSSLFKVAFGGNINISDIDDIVTFCNEQCMHFGYVYHLKSNISFSGSEIDEIIEDCIMSAAGL